LNETDLCDAESGQLLVRGRTHQSFLPQEPEGSEAEQAGGESGKKGFVVDEGQAQKKPLRPPFPTAQGPELAPLKKTVDARRCWMFSGPGKNYHTDKEQAQKLGFPNIVVQGMMSTCFVSQLMLDRFGMGWLEGGRMSIKLTNVLWVDESVAVRGKIREEQTEGDRCRVHCDVWVEKEDDTRVALGSASALRV
jgi:acyl dehydratase